MRTWILKSHLSRVFNMFLHSIIFSFNNSECICDIAVFAVCTCKMKVREMIYFYTVFMQMLSIGTKSSVRHVGR